MFSDTPPPIEPAAQRTAASSVPRRSRLQFGLRGLLLMTAIAAVWGTHYMNLRTSRHLEARISIMRQFKNELRVDDPTRISIVKRSQLWYDEHQWDLFLPSGDYQLCLATEQVGVKDLAPPDSCVALPPGRLRLELLQSRAAEGWKIAVQQDGSEVQSLSKPADWNSGRSSSGAGFFDTMKELPPDKPIVLFRRRFGVDTPQGASDIPKGPCAGVLLWIEPAGDGGRETGDGRRSAGPQP